MQVKQNTDNFIYMAHEQKQLINELFTLYEAKIDIPRECVTLAPSMLDTQIDNNNDDNTNKNTKNNTVMTPTKQQIQTTTTTTTAAVESNGKHSFLLYHPPKDL